MAAGDEYWLPLELLSYFGTPLLRVPFVVSETHVLPSTEGYVFVKLLGAGSFGEVYLVNKTDPTTGITSARAFKVIRKKAMMKRYRKALPRDSEDHTPEMVKYKNRPIELACREAVAFAAAAASSEGRKRVAVLHGLYEDPDFLGFDLEFMTAGPLSSWDRPASDPHTMAVIAQIFQCLAYLHNPTNFGGGCCIAHRDIKKDNILHMWQDTLTILPPVVKLADFGLSRPMVASTLEPTNVGNAQTKAPEVQEAAYFGDEGDMISVDDLVKSDVWSAGIVALQLLGHKYMSTEQIISLLQKPDYFQRLETLVPLPNAADFFQKVFVVAPSGRISAAAALEHPFLKSHIP